MAAKTHNALKKEVHSTDIVELIPYCPGQVSQKANHQTLIQGLFSIESCSCLFAKSCYDCLFSFIQISRVIILISHQSICLASDVQGFVTPPKVQGRGQEGKSQGKDFMTLNRPLTLNKGRVFQRFSCFHFSNIKKL